MKEAIALYADGEISRFVMPEDELTTLQQIVGGWVQCVPLADNLTLWCNDEGKLMGLPHNPLAQHIWNRFVGGETDFIVGNVVLFGDADENGDSLGLSKPLANLIMGMLLQE